MQIFRFIIDEVSHNEYSDRPLSHTKRRNDVLCIIHYERQNKTAFQSSSEEGIFFFISLRLNFRRRENENV